jgi:hypothetical protein
LRKTHHSIGGRTERRSDQTNDFSCRAELQHLSARSLLKFTAARRIDWGFAFLPS